MQTPSTPRSFSPAVAVALSGGSYSIVAGASALLGWALDMPLLTDWTSQGISMFPNTAICAGTAGAVLILAAIMPSSVGISLARILSSFVVLIAGLTFIEHLSGFDFGIDTLLFNRSWGQSAAAAPMRMGPPASVAFLILGVAFILATGSSSSRQIASQLGLLTLVIPLLSVTGYWFGANQLFGAARFTGIALGTSTVIAALSIGLLASLPEYGLAAALRRDGPGGAVHRRLLGPVVVVPLLLGWLRILGQHADLYDTEFGTAIRTIAEIILFFGLIWWTANSIDWHAAKAAQAQARLAAIIESSDAAVISNTLDGVVETWNAGAERTFGYAASEAIGKGRELIIPPNRFDEDTHILRRLSRGERIEQFETVRTRKDGGRIDVSVTVSPIVDSHGRIVGASAILRDITARIRSEQRLRAIVETTPECVKIVNPDGAVEFMNPAGLRMVEADSEQRLKGHCVLELLAPEHRVDWQAYHDRVCAGEKLAWEFEIIGLQGARRWMETHAVPLQLVDGVVGQLAVTRDITDRKRMECERNELLDRERAARDEAERANRLKDEFLSTLSHELRTPLNAIYGWSQLLNPSSDSSDLEQGLEAIQRNARAQARLIEDLLDMSRIVSGKVRLDMQLVDLRTVVQSAISSILPAAEIKNICIATTPEAKPFFIEGDPARLQQVVWNLLSNAIKFTPRGGHVDVALNRIDAHVVLTVRDDGIGIQSDLLPVVFERFRQIDSGSTRSQGGLGLGLSIAKQLVEMHGGTIRAESQGEGHGTSFVVALNASGTDSMDELQGVVEPNAVFDHSHENLSGVKVLVVDDEPDARNLVRHLLTRCGAEVRTAGSAAQGLEGLRSFRPDVLISDIGMPTTDGYEFIQQIRTLDKTVGGLTPAIALTAFARSEDAERALRAGFQMHVIKPVESKALANAVSKLASDSHAERDAF